MEPLSDELVLAAVVAAVLLGIYLLRHIIAFAFKLIVFVGLVLAGVWAWQHRAELVDAAEPYLGPIGNRLEALDLSDVRNLLADLLTDEDPGAADDTGVTDVTDVFQEPGETDPREESGGATDGSDRKDAGGPDPPATPSAAP